MAKVTISNVDVRDNPCTFRHTFQFEITFECAEDLSEDLEWKLIYVGSAESEQYDQVLDTIAVGPVIAGKHMFVFETNAPNIAKIPKSEIVGVTVVLLTCYYRQQEFIRVGYYVNNEYNDPELKENPPTEPLFDKLQRNILATCPRVTRFKIDWGMPTTLGGATAAATNGAATNGAGGSAGGGGNIAAAEAAAAAAPPPMLSSSSSSCGTAAAAASMMMMEGTQDSLLSLPTLDCSAVGPGGDHRSFDPKAGAGSGSACTASLDSFPVPRDQSEPMQM